VTVGPVVVKPRDPSLGDQRCVAVLNTGGTISMKANAVGSLEPSPGYLAERVCAMAEFRRADMPAVDLFELLPLIDSSDMGPEDWTRIAAIIESLYYEYDGFVVVMGTDTMAYCGSALSFLLENLHKPVVLTGAMLPLVDLFNDAHRNLIVSIVLASILDVPEVCIFINDKLMRGNRTVKVNSSGLDAFDSPNFPPLALLETGIRFRPHLCLPQPRGRFRVHKALSTAVAVWRMVPGFDDEYIRVSVEHATSLRAIVLELYGTGNLSARKRTLIDALSKAIDKGIIIVAASQCLRGTVNLSAYALGKQLESIGVVQAGDMTTEALCAKLSYLLAVPGITRDQVISYMGRSLRGEITETKPVIVMGGRGLHGVLPMPQQLPLPAAGFGGVGGGAGAGFGGSVPVAHPVDPLHPLHRSHLSTGSFEPAALPASSPGTGSSASAARALALSCEAGAGSAADAASAAGTGGTAAPVRVVTQPSPHSVTWGGAGGYHGHPDGSGAAVAVALPHESTIKITGDTSVGALSARFTALSGRCQDFSWFAGSCAGRRWESGGCHAYVRLRSCSVFRLTSMCTYPLALSLAFPPLQARETSSSACEPWRRRQTCLLRGQSPLPGLGSTPRSLPLRRQPVTGRVASTCPLSLWAPWARWRCLALAQPLAYKRTTTTTAITTTAAAAGPRMVISVWSRRLQRAVAPQRVYRPPARRASSEAQRRPPRNPQARASPGWTRRLPSWLLSRCLVGTTFRRRREEEPSVLLLGAAGALRCLPSPAEAWRRRRRRRRAAPPPRPPPLLREARCGSRW